MTVMRANSHLRSIIPVRFPLRNLKIQKKLSLIANIGCILSMVILAIPFLMLGMKYIPDNAIWMIIGAVCGGLSLLPHELLHAMCYKKDVYLYNDLSHGLLFVVGTEDMSKARFIVMCLCPNIIMGLVPYTIFSDHAPPCGTRFVWDHLHWNGFWKLYWNVYNAARQMPSKAKTYLCGIRSFWYL